MPFQSTINNWPALGVVGSIFSTAPSRSLSYNLNSSGTAQTIGNAFTVTSGGNPDASGAAGNAGTARVGGTGVFAGILTDAHQYASAGTTGNPLAATLAVPDHTQGQLTTMGEVLVSISNSTASVGDAVYYDNTTGALTSVAAIAGTATQSGYTLTVATSTAGNIGIGSVIRITGAQTVTVTALGTGTGGTGTYTVNVTQTVGSAAAISGNSVAPSGKTMIPNCTVSRYDVTAAGLAVIQLSN